MEFARVSDVGDANVRCGNVRGVVGIDLRLDSHLSGWLSFSILWSCQEFRVEQLFATNCSQTNS
jgi:hypothetical protein